MISFNEIKHLFSEDQVREIETFIDRGILKEELINPSIPVSKMRVILLAHQYNESLNIEDIEDLSLTYDETIIMCINNKIPLNYIKDKNGYFKKYNDKQLMVIQDGILYNIDIRLFSRDINNSSTTMTVSLENLISERNKKVIHRKNKSFSFNLQLQMTRTWFQKLQLKLFGV